MKCIDCLHYEVHKHFFKPDDYRKGFDDYFNDKQVENRCPEFTDRSEWVHLPCKVGDRIYLTDGIRIYKSTIRAIKISSAKTVYFTENISFDERAVGSNIFLTREEAEKAVEKKI